MNRVRAARAAEQEDLAAQDRRAAEAAAAADRSLKRLGLEALAALTQAGVPPKRPHTFRDKEKRTWSAGGYSGTHTEVVRLRIPKPTWLAWGSGRSTIWLTEAGDLYSVWSGRRRKSRFMPLVASETSVSPTSGRYVQHLDLRLGLYIPQNYDQPDIDLRRGIAAGVLDLIEARRHP